MRRDNVCFLIGDVLVWLSFDLLAPGWAKIEITRNEQGRYRYCDPRDGFVLVDIDLATVEFLDRQVTRNPHDV